MDAAQLTEEGYYSVFGKSGARIEIPGCSLCMGNQAQVKEGATVISTSTRNFPNRLGDATDVFLASAELAAVASVEAALAPGAPRIWPEAPSNDLFLWQAGDAAAAIARLTEERARLQARIAEAAEQRPRLEVALADAERRERSAGC